MKNCFDVITKNIDTVRELSSIERRPFRCCTEEIINGESAAQESVFLFIDRQHPGGSPLK